MDRPPHHSSFTARRSTIFAGAIAVAGIVVTVLNVNIDAWW
jgi:hypothetical protein